MQTVASKFAGLDVSKVSAARKTGKLIILYGPSGVGKTPISATLTDSEYGQPAVYLDCEGGSDSISERSDIDHIQLDDWRKAKQFFNELKKQCPWKLIILDNLSELHSRNLDYQERIHSGDPKYSDPRNYYKDSKDDILHMLRELRDLAWRSGIVVVVIAWDTEVDNNGLMTHPVQLPPALRNSIAGIPDLIGYLTVEANGPLRKLSFATTQRAQSKIRRSLKDDVAMKIPEELYGFPLSIAPLLDTLVGGESFPADQFSKPARQVQQREGN